MIIILLINLVVLILGSIFSLFDQVTTLPTLFGFDIDAALVTGVGSLHSLFTTFWVLGDIFNGFLALMSYYGLKMIIRFFFGHRSP